MRSRTACHPRKKSTRRSCPLLPIKVHEEDRGKEVFQKSFSLPVSGEVEGGVGGGTGTSRGNLSELKMSKKEELMSGILLFI